MGFANTIYQLDMSGHGMSIYRETEEVTLTKLVHELPARIQEIYRMKGDRIHPSWDYEKSPYRCMCKVCNS